MKKKRVVVTGIGIVSAYGNDVDVFYDHLLSGKSAVAPIRKFPCDDLPTRIAGEIIGFDPGEYMHKKQARRVDPFISYSIVAGKKALEKANLFNNLENLDKKRCGIIIGSGMGGMSIFSDGVKTLNEKGYKRLTPFFVPFIITNMASALLAIDLGFKGPNYSVSTACATSSFAIFEAAEKIRNGNADLMVCGGSESPMSRIGLAGFVVAKVLSENNDNPEKASRPWDVNRDGFVMGEGAGVLVLESLEHAKARNAPIFGEYLGGAVNCDAHHMTDPISDGSVVAECINAAIKDSEITANDINYINAHATSTIAGDLCEIRAIKKVFSNFSDLKINATKSMTGHCLGAAGAIEAIAIIKAFETNMLHPTINLEQPDKELEGIDAVANKAKAHKIKAALSNSFGFGGHNSALIFAPFSG